VAAGTPQVEYLLAPFINILSINILSISGAGGEADQNAHEKQLCALLQCGGKVDGDHPLGFSHFILLLDGES
jgi:hypothetical protein